MAESNKAQIDVVQFTLQFLAALPQEVKLEVARLLLEELLEELKEDEIDDSYDEDEEFDDPYDEDEEFDDPSDKDLEFGRDSEYMATGPMAMSNRRENNARERIGNY